MDGLGFEALAITTPVEKVTEKMKTLKIRDRDPPKKTKKKKAKWTNAMRLAHNKEKFVCVTCGSKSNKGNWANHQKTKKHKKAARKLKRLHDVHQRLGMPKGTIIALLVIFWDDFQDLWFLWLRRNKRQNKSEDVFRECVLSNVCFWQPFSHW